MGDGGWMPKDSTKGWVAGGGGLRQPNGGGWVALDRCSRDELEVPEAGWMATGSVSSEDGWVCESFQRVRPLCCGAPRVCRKGAGRWRVGRQ